MACVNLASDPNNCRACGTVCAAAANASPVCTGSGCSIACNAGFANCNVNQADGCEVDVRSSNTNCGVCGNTCTTGSICTAGVCTGTNRFQTNYVTQTGTMQQQTRCEQVTNGGFTCVNPIVRYGVTEPGIPTQHGGNDFAAWCRQLGFNGWSGNVTYGTRTLPPGAGQLFGCTSYDETTWHWCDWQDGFWRNQALNHPNFTSPQITSITCN
jgi:hypothetical protein